MQFGGVIVYHTMSRRESLGINLVLLLLVACAPPPAAPATSATPVQATATQRVGLTVGVTGNTADAPLYIAQERGYFREEGFDVTFQPFQSAADTVAPLAGGQIDMGAGAIGAGLFNAIARGLDIKIVADKGQHSGSPQNGFTSALVLAVSKQDFDAGTYKSLTDLKGKTIAMTGTGAGPEVMMDKGLQSAGLSIKDVDVKPLAFPDMLPAFTNKSIDLAVEIEPFVAQGEAKGILMAWKKSEEIYAGQQGGVLMYGPNIAKLGGDAGARIMQAYIRGLRDYYTAFGLQHKNQGDVVTILTKYTSVKDASLYEKMGWDYMNPDGYVNSDAVAEDLKWYVAHGYVQQPPDLAKVVDNEFVDRALQRLGKFGQSSSAPATQ
jgi:NitT/TauT family transport system substrate-binding protein